VFVWTQLYPFQSLNQLAAEIGRDIVARAAPQELPLYRSISSAYLQSPSNLPWRAYW
jgi:hypothetical protein